MSPLRIGIICYPSVGGSGILATRLGLALASKGHDIHLIASELPVEMQEGDNASYFHFHKVNVPDYPLFRYPPFEMVLAAEILQCGREHELDIAHVHYAVPLAASAHYANLMGGAPYVVTLHGSDTHTIGANPQFQAPIRHALLGASCCSAVCEFLKKKAQENFGVSKIQVIPNFIDPERFNNDKKPTNAFFKHNRPTVVHISNFRPIKRTHDIINAWPQVKAEIRDAQLIMVGDGVDAPAAKQLTLKLGVGDSVYFTGIRRDTEAILSQADVFVLASNLEAAPLTLLEAMATATPVIATKTGGIPEIIEDGKQGHLTEIGDIKALGQGMIDILSDEKRAQRMGEAGRQKVLENYIPEKVVPLYEKFYRGVCVDED